MTKRLTRPHKKTGRPTGYRVAYVSRVFEMCLLGLPDERIAELLGTSRAGLNRWKKEYKVRRLRIFGQQDKLRADRSKRI
jgi:hypothetical protein